MKVLISVALALFLVGCSSDTKEETDAPISTESAKVKAEAIVETTKDKAVEVKEDVVTKAEDVADATVEKAQEIKDATVEKAQEIKEATVAKVEEVKQVASTQASGAALYQVCAGCHGADASKPALGKSQIIKGWDADKVSAALHGYKAGTYGGTMKSLMVGQVSKLSDDDIKTLSGHISKL
jgi:cytochrome c553